VEFIPNPESLMPGHADPLRRTRALFVMTTSLFVLAVPGALDAQTYRLVLPLSSPYATVSQVVGLTTLSVDYHRPAVNKRVVWGGLVPWNAVWRAGANENTVFTSTSAFTFGGTTLPAGRYGLFMIPRPDRWTVILSRQANAWGAFSYNPAEDVARMDVTPTMNRFTERVRYDFDQPADSVAILPMEWDSLLVRIPVSVNRTQVVLDSLRTQLRNYARFAGTAWQEAAAWVLANTSDLNLAEAWADTAVIRAPTFASYNIKAAVLERRGKTAEADSLRQAHIGAATEAQVNAYGYQLLNQNRNKEALANFIRNTKDYPDSWNVWDSLGEAYATMGEKSKAITNYQKALGMTNDPAQKQRIEGILAGLK
jgi:Flp pilus assembly protein TadD